MFVIIMNNWFKSKSQKVSHLWWTDPKLLERHQFYMIEKGEDENEIISIHHNDLRQQVWKPPQN